MTKEELLQILSTRSSEMQEIIDERLTLLELCLESSNCVKSDLYSFPDCDISILIKLLLFAVVKNNFGNDYSYDEIINISNSLNNLFKEYHADILVMDIPVLIDMYKYGVSKTVIQYLKNDNLFNKEKLYASISNLKISLDEVTYNKFLDAILAFKKIINKTDITSFLSLLEKIDNDELMLIFNLYKNHYILSLQKEDFQKQIKECMESDLELCKLIKSSLKKNTQKDFFDDFFDGNILSSINDTKRALDIIIKFYKNKFSVWESERKSAVKEKNKLDEVKNFLCSFNKNEIVNAENLIKNIKDENIKCAILKYVFNYNKKYYEELVVKHNMLKSNSELAYKDLFSSNEIDISNVDIHDVMHHKINDLMIMIKLLKQLFKDKNCYIFDILTFTNLSIIEDIYSLTNDGIINKNFMENNIDIFEIDSKKLKTIFSNIALLKSKDINPSILIDDCDMLLIDSNIMDANLNTLISYDLIKSMKTTTNHHYLGNINMTSIVDRLFELGYNNFLKEDLSILNNNNLKRLELLYAMNIPINSKEEFDKIISPNKDFFIKNNSDLDKYVPNFLKFHEKINFNFTIDDLETFKKTEYTYSINEVVISSIKVKRLISQGKNMYDALFYNMYLSDDDYERVIQELKSHILIK